MKTVIIEDEEFAVSALMADVNRFCPELNIIGIAESVQQGISLIDELQPELIFLDIQLSDGLGFEILEKIKNKHIQVIFTTAYSQYAIQAIKFSALDYLLKPINSTDLKNAVAKAIQNNKIGLDVQIENFIKNQSLQNQQKKIALQTTQGIFIHEIQTIIKCTSEGNYTHVHFTDGKKILISKPLKEIEDMLGNCEFERIHHSHMINLNHLTSFIFKDGGYVILSDKSTVPVSKRKKAQLIEKLTAIK